MIPTTEDYDQIDPETRIILKMLSKKDTLTRTKALEELAVRVETLEPEVLTNFLTAWVKHFNSAKFI